MRFSTTSLSLLFLLSPLSPSWAAGPDTRPSDAPPLEGKVLRVVILDDGGAAEKDGDNVAHCLQMVHPEAYSIKKVNGEDIRNGALDNADVAVFPGGSGSGQAKSLQQDGRDKVREFVKKGGGYIGICGGAYLATSVYPWSLDIVNAVVVDRAHWARGRAVLRLDFNPTGKELLDVPGDSVQCTYHQGPLLAPDKKPDLPAYEPLSTFGTEVADKGAPKGVMIGTNAMVRAVFGKGHVFLISPHPEATDGLDYIVRAAVNWISHPESVANPLTGDETYAKSIKVAAVTPTTQASPAVK